MHLNFGSPLQSQKTYNAPSKSSWACWVNAVRLWGTINQPTWLFKSGFPLRESYSCHRGVAGVAGLGLLPARSNYIIFNENRRDPDFKLGAQLRESIVSVDGPVTEHWRMRRLNIFSDCEIDELRGSIAS